MLILSQGYLKEIIAQCEQEFPNEACGILAGKSGQVEKVYLMTNTDKSSESYFMDSREQLKVVKAIRALGLEMVGIYHSHVASLAYPSAHDVEMAFYPEASYVIISLKDRDNPSIRSFKIIEGKITEEKLIIK